MDLSSIVMWVGFSLAAYSVVANDVIQTLGTFLTSNEKNVKWYILWLYAAGILSCILLIGYCGLGDRFYLGGDDIAFDRLDKITIPSSLDWYYILPPIVLMFITRLGIPVSTTFLILTFFSPKSLGGMIQKSVMGYLIAFSVGTIVYMLMTKITEKNFLKYPLESSSSASLWTNKKFWKIAQWLSTGFLWTQWLSQDLANIYVYLGNGQLNILEFIVSLMILIGLLGYIFYSRGGKIQDIVRAKTNTTDIRSATFIDLIYALVLMVFKYNYLGLWEAKLPMSTTWVFIGLLAGRELALAWQLDNRLMRKELKPIFMDLIKVFLGLVISILLVVAIQWLNGNNIIWN